MRFRPLSILLAAALACPAAQAARYTYHGDLMDGDAPAEGAYDLRVRSFANPDASKALGEATELPGVALVEGRFNVELDLPEDADGMTWVEVAVRRTASGDAFERLGDLQPLAKVNGACPGAWALDGNSGMPAGSYLGSADFVPIELRVNGGRVAQFSPGGAVNSYGSAPKVSLGSAANIASGTGATVAGGGASLNHLGQADNAVSNEASANFATVGGGIGSKAHGSWSVVGGGQSNTSDGDYGVVDGGRSNLAGGLASMVGGGDYNAAAGSWSGVAGGYTNRAAGSYSHVAGGQYNLAGGASSFAGGNNARVRIAGNPPALLPAGVEAADYTGLVGGDDGSFVWSSTDFANQPFRSTRRNQFLIRAQGGVGINTADTSSGAALTVADPDTATPGNYVVLRASTRSSVWYIDETTGDSYLRSGSGDLRLETDAGGKYIYTNDKFGVETRPVTNSLEVNGNASKSTAGDWLANSDRRIKSGIEPVSHALDTIMQLRPVTFRYDAAYRAGHKGLDDKRYYNVIAQEFANVFPEAVRGSGEYLAGREKSPENEILQVDTYPAQITAIAAIQELAVQDDALRDEVAALKRDNAALRQQIDALSQRFARLEDRQER